MSASRPRGTHIRLISLAVSEGATTPDPGDKVWAWSSTLGRPIFWTGTRWRQVPAITVSTTAPANPDVGDVWIDTN